MLERLERPAFEFVRFSAENRVSEIEATSVTNRRGLSALLILITVALCIALAWRTFHMPVVRTGQELLADDSHFVGIILSSGGDDVLVKFHRSFWSGKPNGRFEVIEASTGERLVWGRYSFGELKTIESPAGPIFGPDVELFESL